MMQGLPDLVTIIDGDGQLSYVSESSARLLGWPARQLVGRRACDFIAPDDRRNCATWLAHAQAFVDAPPLSHRLVLADGSLGEFETRIRSLPADSGCHVVAVSRDVSDRAQVDHQLDSVVDLLRETNDIVTQGVLVVTDGGLILTVNRAAERLLGLSRDHLVGSDIGDHLGIPFPPATSESSSRIVHRPLVASEPAEKAPPGELRFRVRTVPLVHHAGAATCFGVLLDEADDPPPAHRHERGQARSSAGLAVTLSPRELDVLGMLADGLDVRAISVELHISIHTARYYVKSILRKLDVRTQAQAVAVALRGGLPDIS